MKIKNYVIVVSLFFGLITSSCQTDSELNLVNFTTISQNDLYGNGQENITQQNLIITNANAWNELMAKMNSVNTVSNGFTETKK
jgi:hypothetical protein